MQAIVDELLDRAGPRGRMDVIADFAEPLPAVVIAELLGVPPEDHRRFKAWSTQLLSLLGSGSPAEAGPRFQEALDALLDYLGVWRGPSPSGGASRATT